LAEVNFRSKEEVKSVPVVEGEVIREKKWQCGGTDSYCAGVALNGPMPVGKIAFSATEGNMRSCPATILACLWALAVLQPGHSDDKEDKKREKQLAELEPRLAKEEWAVLRKKVIAKLTGQLDKAEQIDLFRLNPRGLPEGNKEGKKEFHGYEVLSELRVKVKEQRKQATAFLGKTLHWNQLRIGACFNPRHGLRAAVGKKTLDFLICFECWQVRIFEGKEQLATLPLGFSEKNNPIERLLAKANKKAKDGKY
jgi:hypothetical protein